MPLTRLCIKNFKSIKSCDISFSELNVLIGENGTGKTNILDAINYFYRNLTESNTSDRIFDENNHYSNELRITLVYDLSEFVKISKSNSDELPNLFDDQLTEKTKYGGYYKAIISMASKSKDKQLYVELSQIKGYPIRWNYSYEDRLIFKSLFPIFYIDTRNLDVTEWGYMWDVLGELGKVSNAERKTIESKINETLLDDNQEMSRKLKVITDIFSAADVSVKPAMSREFAQNLTKVFFSGEVIRQRGKWLGYYSTGTNSVKYIELLIKSIDAISKTKMKEPIVLFDEPEISLHSSYLDELTGAMLDVNSRLRIVVATHSSRLTKNIVTGAEKVSLYNVKLTNKYSNIQRMKKFPQYSPSSKYRVSDDHINSYFSRGILFVEGETELELFSNPYIKILFPKLKEIDVFKAMSDEPILNIMNPKLVNTHTPYMCLIDMDKAIRYDKEMLQNQLVGKLRHNAFIPPAGKIVHRCDCLLLTFFKATIHHIGGRKVRLSGKDVNNRFCRIRLKFLMFELEFHVFSLLIISSLSFRTILSSKVGKGSFAFVIPPVNTRFSTAINGKNPALLRELIDSFNENAITTR